MLNYGPALFEIFDFVTDLERKELLEIAELNLAHLKQSKTDKSAQVSGVDSNRTSRSISFAKQQTALLRKLEARAAEIVGVNETDVEGLQLVRYEAGQFFGLHHDAGRYDEEGDWVDTSDAPSRSKFSLPPFLSSLLPSFLRMPTCSTLERLTISVANRAGYDLCLPE